jgi:hypothetical protein
LWIRFWGSNGNGNIEGRAFLVSWICTFIHQPTNSVSLSVFLRDHNTKAFVVVVSSFSYSLRSDANDDVEAGTAAAVGV